MAKILCTGAAGFLGSVLCPALLHEGHSVTALDNFSHGIPSLSACCGHPDFDIVRGDVRNENLMASLVDEHEVIIPLAAIVGAPACDRDRWTAEQVNYDAIETLTTLVDRSHKIIFPNTNSGYGSTDGTPCTEDTPLNPVSLYGQLKKAAESVLRSKHTNTVVFRLATVYGMSPRPRTDLLVNEMVWRAVTDGFVALYEPNYQRNFLSIHDAAAAFIFALDNWEDMCGNVYNVGNDEDNMSKAELCDIIRQQVPGFRVTEMAGFDVDQRNYNVSSARMMALGWKPQCRVADGVRELIAGYRQFRKFAQGNV